MRTDEGSDDGKDRTAGFINRLKRALGALDLARNVEKAIDKRLAALGSLDQEVKVRVRRLEWMNQSIVESEARADDVVRVFRSVEQRLADLREQERALQAVEATVAACEDRAWTVSTKLDRDLAAGEAREAAVVAAVQQLERRVAAMLDGFETRVGDGEARTRSAEETITRLEACVGQLEQRAAAVVGAFAQAAHAKNDLEEGVAALQSQLREITRAADDEAARLRAVGREADARDVRRATRATNPSARTPLITLRLRRRRPSASRRRPRARAIAGAAALMLAAAIVLLVGSVWRRSPVEAGNSGQPLPLPVLPGRTLTLAPVLAVPPLTPRMATIRG